MDGIKLAALPGRTPSRRSPPESGSLRSRLRLVAALLLLMLIYRLAVSLPAIEVAEAMHSAWIFLQYWLAGGLLTVAVLAVADYRASQGSR